MNDNLLSFSAVVFVERLQNHVSIFTTKEIDRASLSHSECRLVWPVPYLSDGRGVTVVVDMGTVAAEADGERRFGQPVAGVHTWRNTGAAMNMTGLMLLDSKADALISRSGESITIETDLLLLDNQPTYVAFARMMP